MVAMFECFSTNNTDAVNATQLIDHRNDDGSLWSALHGHMQLCSSSSAPPASRCLVCIDRIVRVVCCDMGKGAQIALEGKGGEFPISKSECPVLGSADAAWWMWPLIIFSIIFIFITVAAVVFFIQRKRSNNRPAVENLENNTGEPGEQLPLKETVNPPIKV